ncbi:MULTISPECIES: Na+/H+ antiporter subunit E [unclassified Haladaptatus]|uniref:Na+/H+ antiporter subunit E n=1 Tax=unclassified Haladaptatus TaxID=2622732 RepID=UPI0023E7ABF5|nr:MULTISPECIES: Na+/H+ antiporter subunit E [unclassified Haladaptatus]
MKRWPVLGVALAVLWLFVRGAPLFEPVALLGEFLLGLALGVPIAFAFRRFYADDVKLGRATRAVPYALLYLLVFVRELVTANVDVAYRVLSPSMPIHPGVVEVPLRVTSDLGITTIANSITLTPGTLTMDYDEEKNALYVHAIDARDPAAIVAPIRTWEDYALVIFDEELSPDDPVPKLGGEPDGN